MMEFHTSSLYRIFLRLGLSLSQQTTNKTAALVVDLYSSVGNSAVCVQGTAETIEKGEEFSRLYKKFHDRFEWVRQDPWKEGEAPFVKVTPSNKVSWGLE
jgi:nitroimidazol reductase NimA-like FMN-containing flavoprotein (pyridoxamine 5'-phosphate oxidase superfamily)